jgi:hypothetical protein
MSFSKKWDRFKHLDETEYWNEICAMSEARLRAEHKIIQQTVLSASAGAGASYAAGFFTMGLAWGVTAVNARRINVNIRQKDLIEKRLSEKGWNGHQLRKRDFALGVGPAVAAEMVIPAGGSLLGQAAHHATTTAAGHVASTATQHAAQATSQHIAQMATQHVAAQIASQHAGDAMSAVAHHTTTFLHAAAEGAQSEIFTASHGAVGHLSSQYFSSLPIDSAAAQAQILGAAAGQAVVVEGMREGLSKGTSQLTKYSIRKAIERSEKKGVSVTETEMSSDDSDDGEHDVDLDSLHVRAVKVLLEAHYKSLDLYERDGTVKTDITRVDTCDTCDCVDYDDKRQSGASATDGASFCLCGHNWGGHSRQGKNDWITTKFCEMWYARMEHREHDGTLKTTLTEIEGCRLCTCKDYNDGEPTGQECSCGHAWNRHHAGESTTPQDCGMYSRPLD